MVNSRDSWLISASTQELEEMKCLITFLSLDDIPKYAVGLSYHIN